MFDFGVEWRGGTEAGAYIDFQKPGFQPFIDKYVKAIELEAVGTML